MRRSPDVTANMVSFCHHLFVDGNKILALLLLLLLLFGTAQVALPAEGRTTHKLLLVAETRKNQKEEVDEEFVVPDAMLGSRPPRCERRCSSCGGRCGAVQVPALSLGKNGIKHHLAGFTTARDDDNSNYKPLRWKCRCGDTIFNP